MSLGGWGDSLSFDPTCYGGLGYVPGDSLHSSLVPHDKVIASCYYFRDLGIHVRIDLIVAIVELDDVVSDHHRFVINNQYVSDSKIWMIVLLIS